MKHNIITFINPEFGLELDLSVNGFEFPIPKSETDANWLIVKLECRYRDKIFMKEDPSLIVRELEDIQKWFESISRNAIPQYTNLKFTEPNLEFQLFGSKDELVRFGVRLDAEFKPSFNIYELGLGPTEPDDEFVLVFESSLQAIETYASNFQNMLVSLRHHRP